MPHLILDQQFAKATLQLKRVYSLIGMLEECKRKLGPCVGVAKSCTPSSSNYHKKIESIYAQIVDVQNSLSKDYLR